MSKKWLEKNEWYPVAEIVGEETEGWISRNLDEAKKFDFYQVEIPEDKLQWMEQVFAEFETVQSYLFALIKGENK